MVVLVIVLLVLFFQNYRLGTYLIGWDNLMPELNILMNINRSLTAIWQSYQGLGLVGGMAHSTDLIRQLVILPFTYILPSSLIRYGSHFFLIALGTISIYYGLKKHFKFNNTVCTISALFYLLNFGTLQNFWAPFEAFSMFWGFFPLLIFSLWNYLDHPNKKSLIQLIIVNILAIPSFYVQTVFVVYMFAVAAILIPYIKTKFKLSLKTIFIILCLNAFWLLPFLYFLKYDVYNPRLGIGNLIASPQTFARNQFRGTILDFLLMRGYYYDFPLNGGYLMSIWRDHFANIYVLIAGYLLGLISLFGILKTKRKSLFILFFICAIALLSKTPIFSQINYFVRQISIFDQIFRSPYTKFIVPTIFCFTIFFAHALNYLNNIFAKIIVIAALIIISFPSFNGNFIYPRLRQNIPSDYFSLINYFKTQAKDNRIAVLPSGNYWGWTTYRSGITGSGFLWYGVEQPILDRAFDVWSLKNEQYYWELNYATQKQDPELLNKIFDKYAISYLIFDNNIIFPDEPLYTKTAIKTRNIIETMENLTLVNKFGQVSVYKTNINKNPITTNPPDIKQSNFFYSDTAYLENNNYISSSNPNITYPLAHFFTNRLQNENKFQIKIENDQLFIDNYSFPVSTVFQKQEFVHLQSTGPVSIYSTYYPEISYDKSYLVKIVYRNVANYPLYISGFGEQTRQVYFTTLLDNKKDWQTAWFVIPKYRQDTFDKSLTLVINNASYNGLLSINDIKDISIYQIPYDDMIKTKIITPPIYQNTSYITNHQAYHPGWIAFYFDGKKPVFLKNHVMLNNWGNAWELPKDTYYTIHNTIYMIFWPQILQYIGFILGFIVISTQIHSFYNAYQKKKSV